MTKARLIKKEEDQDQDFMDFCAWMEKFRNYLIEADTDGSDRKVILEQFKLAIKGNRYFKVTRWSTIVREVKGYMPLGFI